MPAWLLKLNEHFPICAALGVKPLKELVQAAGFDHPGAITAAHIVRRDNHHQVKLLANLLTFIKPGSLLAGDLPHEVFRVYWPMAQARSFAVAGLLTAALLPAEAGARS